VKIRQAVRCASFHATLAILRYGNRYDRLGRHLSASSTFLNGDTIMPSCILQRRVGMEIFSDMVASTGSEDIEHSGLPSDSRLITLLDEW